MRRKLRQSLATRAARRQAGKGIWVFQPAEFEGVAVDLHVVVGKGVGKEIGGDVLRRTIADTDADAAALDVPAALIVVPSEGGNEPTAILREELRERSQGQEQA